MPVTVSVNYRGSFPPLTLVKGVLCVLTAFSLGLNKTLFRHFLALVRRQHSLVPGSNISLFASLGASEITVEGCFPVCLKLSCFWMRDTVPTQSNTAAMGGLRYKIDTHLCVQMSSGSWCLFVLSLCSQPYPGPVYESPSCPGGPDCWVTPEHFRGCCFPFSVS